MSQNLRISQKQTCYILTSKYLDWRLFFSIKKKKLNKEKKLKKNFDFQTSKSTK